MTIHDFTKASQGVNPIRPVLAQGDAIRGLYHNLIESWNARDAASYAALFSASGGIIGFDGSHVAPRETLESVMRHVFAAQNTAQYIYKIREVLFLSENTALLRAIAGMIPKGRDAIDPNLNVIHVMTATRRNDAWSIALLQNTPAQFHGMPDVSRMMTDELKELV